MGSAIGLRSALQAADCLGQPLLLLGAGGASDAQHALPEEIRRLLGPYGPATAVEEARWDVEEGLPAAQDRGLLGTVREMVQERKQGEEALPIGYFGFLRVPQPGQQFGATRLGEGQDPAGRGTASRLGALLDQTRFHQPGDGRIERPVTYRADVATEALDTGFHLVSVQGLLEEETQNRQLQHASSSFLRVSACLPVPSRHAISFRCTSIRGTAKRGVQGVQLWGQQNTGAGWCRSRIRSTLSFSRGSRPGSSTWSGWHGSARTLLPRWLSPRMLRTCCS